MEEENKVETKVCKKCGIEKNVNDFQICNISKNNIKNRRAVCKDCYNNICKIKQYEKFPKRLERKNIKLKESETGLRICIKCSIEKNIKECFRIRNNVCKECEKKYRIEYIKNNYEQFKQKDNERHKRRFAEDEKVRKARHDYVRNKRKNDLNFKLRSNVSRHIGRLLKKNKSGKNGKSIMKYLPYTIEELRIHIESLWESWMTWQNYGVYDSKTWTEGDITTYKWQIDHIIPQSDLPYTSMEDENFKKCWALDNLRPLNAKQNIIEGINRVRHKNKTK